MSHRFAEKACIVSRERTGSAVLSFFVFMHARYAASAFYRLPESAPLAGRKKIRAGLLPALCVLGAYGAPAFCVYQRNFAVSGHMEQRGFSVSGPGEKDAGKQLRLFLPGAAGKTAATRRRKNKTGKRFPGCCPKVPGARDAEETPERKGGT